jgi:hypothetical protein
MPALRKHQALRVRPDREATRAGYRSELRRLADQRKEAAVRGEQIVAEMARLLPKALQAGISVAEAAELTEFSRPTVYRMLAEMRKRQDLRGTVLALEDLLAKTTAELRHAPLPAELAGRCAVSTEEVFEQLMLIYRPLCDEFASLGPSAVTTLIDVMPELVNTESIALKMLLLNDMATARVAWSMQLSETEVLGWASLGLLRVLPRIRRESRS